jgi:serine/threonine protein kinase
MELVEGPALSKYVESEARLPPKKIESIFEQALDILEYLHGLTPPVIHRDIKPANLILRPDGRLAVVDFGGVRRRLGGGKSTVVGTFGYMAPEQLHGDADERSDVYSLGATMAALLTGTDASNLPHDGLRLDLPTLGLSDRWLELLEPMLEPEPKNRLPSIAAVREAYRRKRPKAKRGAPRPSAPPPRSGSTDDASKALVKIPAGARALAKAPAPFSVLVWILTALGGGALLVFEVVMLPLIYQIWSAILRERKDSESDRQMEADFEDFRAKVKSSRQTLDYVAKHTRPG